MSKNLSSVVEFCRDNGIGKTLFYRELAAGRLQACKVGKKTMVSAESAAAWRKSLPKITPREAKSSAPAEKLTAKSEHAR